MVVMRSRKGFTLLELLMVVIIVGILATLAVPQYAGFVERARAAEATSTIASIRSAENLRKLETGSYAATDAQLQTYVNYPTGGTATYWTYAATAGTPTTYTITATRTNKPAGAAAAGQTIVLSWDDTIGATWTGTHPGVPAS